MLDSQAGDDEGGQVDTRKWGRGPRALVVASAAVVLAVLATTVPAAATTTSAERARIAAIVRATTAAGTARMTASESIRRGNGAVSLDTSRGVLDFRNHRAASTTSAQVDQGKQLTLRQRVLGGFQYLSPPDTSVTPPLRSEHPVVSTKGKHWVRVPSRSGSLPPLAYLQPSGGAPQLDGPGVHWVTSGPGRVGGVATTHTRIAIPTQVQPRQVQTLSPSPRSAETIDFWVDGRHRLRRLRDSYRAGPLRTQVAFELSDFGAPVHVAAPPASESRSTTARD